MSSSPTASAPSIPPSSPLSSVPSDDDSNDELVDVQPSEVEFLNTLSTKIWKKNGNNLVITFKVEIRGKLCVMKVVCDYIHPSAAPIEHSTLILAQFKRDEYLKDYFTIEHRAYQLLKEKGFCKRGLVPKFYGVIQHINVELWPDLHAFRHHKWRPNAVLIEYIPDAEKICLNNFSQDNVNRLCSILAEFHQAGLLHGDPYPRNMMVVQGKLKDRVFWLDFDSSKVVDRQTCSEQVERQLEDEMEEVIGIAEALAIDAKTGILEEALYFYY
ncbi:serine threonine kinase [Cordyceps militaris]|uniref:Serine threonine kinase n=1 Tax=Cordyceps militaris TaxID=73501 RepID=A0A2H4SMH2_CORMI|nr:serine threonine kinase [Cordyceps militaris]